MAEQQPSARTKRKHATVSSVSKNAAQLVSSTATEHRAKKEKKMAELDTSTSHRKQGVEKKQDRKPSLLEKMKARLQGGQFRMLNEKIYTCKSDVAFDHFKKDKKSFFKYHSGYQEQTASWPKLPVDLVIDWLQQRKSNLVVADFGCGEAKLARSVKNKVYSLDFVAANEDVIECNMAHSPLESDSVNVAVFCLSLMGTDYGSFLAEAYRVLKTKGHMLIAEVKSRFDPANGGADPKDFVTCLEGVGFKLLKKDESNRMFLMFYFQKISSHVTKEGMRGIHWPPLKPCLYKRR